MVDKMKKVQADLRYDNLLVAPCVHRAGGLAMHWKNGVNLDIQTYSLNHIDARIMTNPHAPWRIIGFYGKLEERRKQESWRFLKHHHSKDNVPWVCIRDFNEILCSTEK